MKIPLMVRIGALVLATTAFYGYVGQMVPQKEVQPPQETALGSNMTTADMVKVGREIMEGKGLCVTCHTIGKTGALRFPDLEGIGSRAKSRVPGLSDVEYLAQSMYEPAAFVVPGFPPAMPAVNKPPIGLNDQEILCVLAYLQTLGGTPTITLQTKHRYNGATAAPAVAPAPADAPGPGDKQPLTPKKGAQLGPAVSTPDMIAIAGAMTSGVLRSVVGAARNESSVLVVMPHSGPGAPQARPAGVERGNGAPAPASAKASARSRRSSLAVPASEGGNDGDGGSGGAKPPGLVGAVAR